MKKAFTLFLFLLAFTCMLMGQPFSTAKESYEAGNAPETGQFFENPNRDAPPGTLVYSIPFTCPPFNGRASETWTDWKVADDFVLTENSSIDVVRWWFLMSPGVVGSNNWIIRIYENANCLPASLIGTWNISAGEVNYTYVCSEFGYPIYDYWTQINPPFQANAGQTYWVSVQADIISPYRAFWSTAGQSGQYVGCQSAFTYSPDIYSPDDQICDRPFELYSSGAVQTPISNWALYMGLGLILVFAIVRYRRLF